MTVDRGPIEPTLDVPLEQALEDMTGFELIAVQKHYGTNDVEALGAIKLMCGVVWAYENRNAKVDWSTVERMTMRELAGYFAAVADPDDEEGKAEPPTD